MLPGEIVCLVGPNGSGKSTAINMIAGVMKGDSGSCLLDGVDTSLSPTKKHIGFLEEDAFYYQNISVIHLLNFIWGLKYPGQANDEIFRLLAVFDMFQYRNNRIKSLSMGMRKRVGLISALMNCPKLIVLDEPTNSIDTKSLIMLKQELLNAQNRGSHIIVSGHVLDFIKAIASRIIFIKDGLVVQDMRNGDTVNLDYVYKTLFV
jgi:ABC-2 type transport system ATP-binding protein